MTYYERVHPGNHGPRRIVKHAKKIRRIVPQSNHWSVGKSASKPPPLYRKLRSNEKSGNHPAKQEAGRPKGEERDRQQAHGAAKVRPRARKFVPQMKRKGGGGKAEETITFRGRHWERKRPKVWRAGPSRPSHLTSTAQSTTCGEHGRNGKTRERVFKFRNGSATVCRIPGYQEVLPHLSTTAYRAKDCYRTMEYFSKRRSQGSMRRAS